MALLERFQDRLFTASQVANGKPAPDLFLHAAARMGFEPQNCLVVEDSISGLDAALAAGMSVLHFAGGSHLSGIAEPLPPRHAQVVAFDKWSDFFEMAPQLKRDGNVHG